MARQYQVNSMVRFVNRVMIRLNQWGIAAPSGISIDHHLKLFMRPLWAEA